MKALAVYPHSRQIKVIDHREPRLNSPTQVKLRMLDIGICGTDREIAVFQYGTPPPGSDYLVVGHESLGEVVETGPQVSRLKKGDLVVTMVRRPCSHPECMACQSGRQDFCYTGDFTERGIKGQHGFMTELVVDEEKYMNIAPRELREIAVLIEPLTIAEKALIQLWQVQQRLPWACPAAAGQPPAYCHKAVVIGAGPVGLLGAMALACSGFQTFVYSRSGKGDPRSSLVESFGATYISAEEHTPAQLTRRVGNIDLVYEAAGASRVAFEVMEIIGTNAVFIFTGVPGRKAPIELDTDLIMRNLVLKNQVVFGTVNAGRDAFQAAIRDLATFAQRWPDQVRQLITARHPIEHAPELLLAHHPGGIKHVIAI